MRYRTLGRTGLKVSETGFGTIPILSGSVPVLPEYYSPSEEKAVKIMEYAFSLGCNFYDTAIPAEYGDAEYKLGLFAKGVRDKIIISDKARCYSGGEMYKAVLSSTENLGTRPDIYFVHQADPGNADEIFGRYGAVDALCDLKREGKIGFTGIASHYFEVLERADRDSRIDVLQGSGNILERGMAERLGELSGEKGFILNKVLGAGVMTGFFSPAELIGGVLSYPVSCALIGIGTEEQAEAAMGKEFPPEEIPFHRVTERLREKFELIPCTRCQRCVCPNGTEIHTIFRQYNYCHMGKEFWALKKLTLNISNAALSCARCTEMPCREKCPMGLDIPGLIRKVDGLVKNVTGYDYRNLF